MICKSRFIIPVNRAKNNIFLQEMSAVLIRLFLITMFSGNKGERIQNYCTLDKDIHMFHQYLLILSTHVIWNMTGLKSHSMHWCIVPEVYTSSIDVGFSYDDDMNIAKWRQHATPNVNIKKQTSVVETACIFQNLIESSKNVHFKKSSLFKIKGC